MFPSISILRAHSAARHLDQPLGLEIDSVFSHSPPRGRKTRGVYQALGYRSGKKYREKPTLRDWTVPRWQGIQMQQPLEPLKQQFHLPTQPAEFQDRLIRELFPTQRRKHP